jgi:DNA-binding NtrC family response regulator
MPRILVVNEIEEIRGMVKVILEAAGFEASTAGDAKEAMDALYNESFDLVITDLNMPGSMTGEELLYVIKESENETEAIVLTSQASINSAIECLRNDLACDYLTNPIDSLKSFIATVHKALKKRATKIKNNQRKKALYQSSVKLKEMNQKLKASQQELIDNEKKDVYDATVLTAAHNINQPLTVLLLKAEMVEEKLKYTGADDELIPHIEAIKRSALKIYDIMDQFKSISRPVYKDYLDGVKMIDLSKARKVKEWASKEKTAPVEEIVPEKTNQKSILIVEDEVGIKDLVSEILTNQGYTTFVATNGEEGLNTFNQNKDKIGLLITDIRMPRLTGIELYREIMKIAPKLPVICLTGYDIDREAERLHEEGKIQLLTKPFALKELVGLVKKEMDSDSGFLQASSD